MLFWSFFSLFNLLIRPHDFDLSPHLSCAGLGKKGHSWVAGFAFGNFSIIRFGIWYLLRRSYRLFSCFFLEGITVVDRVCFPYRSQVFLCNNHSQPAVAICPPTLFEYGGSSIL